jgi:hypothetical protein
MSEFKVVKFKTDYADEFDVEGVRIFTNKQWKEWQEGMKADLEFPYEWYFGSNEVIEFNSWVDFISKFEVDDINLAQAEVIQYYVGELGHFPEY